MRYFLLSEDNMFFMGLSALLTAENAKLSLLLMNTHRYIMDNKNNFYIIDSRIIRGNIDILSTETVSAVIIDFARGYLSGVPGNITRLDASQPPEALVSHLFSVLQGERKTTDTRYRRNMMLSADERDVLTLFTSGHSVRETAALCGISEKKVYSVRRSIRLRMGFRNFNRLYLSIKNTPLSHS